MYVYLQYHKSRSVWAKKCSFRLQGPAADSCESAHVFQGLIEGYRWSCGRVMQDLSIPSHCRMEDKICDCMDWAKEENFEQGFNQTTCVSEDFSASRVKHWPRMMGLHAMSTHYMISSHGCENIPAVCF